MLTVGDSLIDPPRMQVGPRAELRGYIEAVS
jgi:hypothetical protein